MPNLINDTTPNPTINTNINTNTSSNNVNFTNSANITFQKDNNDPIFYTKVYEDNINNKFKFEYTPDIFAIQMDKINTKLDMVHSLVNEYGLSHKVIPIESNVVEFLRIFNIDPQEVAMNYSFSFIKKQ